MLCNNCRTENLNTARFCTNCGDSLASLNEGVPSQLGSGHILDNNNDLQEYYEDAIGCKNTAYYLSRFNRFDAKGVGASWHWPAFFVSFYWLLYRKMWAWALLYFLLPAPLTIFETVLSPVSEMAVVGFYVVYFAVIFILFPMYANALYYRHLNKKILKAKRLCDAKEKRLRMLVAEGGTSGVIIVVILIFVFVFILGVVAAVAIPAYQDYTIRAKVAEGLAFSADYKNKVEAYAAHNQQWPQSIADISDAGKIASPAIGDITIDNGVVIIKYAGSAQIEGKSIALTPSVNDENYIVWECSAVDMDNKYLPISCRD